MTEYDTILVPTDGSEGALAAADHAVGLAERYDATVHVLAVVDVDEVALTTPTDVNVGDLKSTLRASAQSNVDEIVSRAERADRPTEEAILVGVPHRAIVDYVEDEGIDLIVMGTHGRTGVRRVLLGSVAERVVRTSPSPVMTIRPDADAAE
ncbi:hypothetical protein BV210_04510 [Halorientalis sp. IM1011]|uniref:universal stress protein n=1 Tax=Halorientalis sp. IM1011 TaxID=1932360 RepID=UPI00097CD546|nr:universal stress protein [Halorientalis sp. IM1011]AQL42024.1 hypothetical protein BV210_04510 [Halorientalis sp. IM1011]